MMLQSLRVLVFGLGLVLPFSENSACTSFILYADDIWYGMNFDFPEVPLKIVIDKKGELEIFKAEFPNGNFCTAMNSNGLFTNFQMMFLNGETPTYSDVGNTITLNSIRNYAINNCSSVDQVLNYLGEQVVIPAWDEILHSVFADVQGKSIILEPMGDETGLVIMQDSFLVMTNFPNSEFDSSAYDAVYGFGSDRYQTAINYLTEHSESFTFEKGIALLKMVRQTGGSYPTLFSVLYHPGEKEAFICLQGDFSKIWRVSIPEQTLETYSGFDAHESRLITSSGIQTSNFPKPANTTNSNAFQTSPACSVYPNPSAGVFIIDLPTSESPVEVEVFQSDGGLVWSKSAWGDSAIDVDLSGKSPGIFFVRVKFEREWQTYYLVKN